MNLANHISTLITSPPTKAVANIANAYKNVVMENPPPKEYLDKLVPQLARLYPNKPYGLSLAVMIAILQTNNIGMNLPKPNDPGAIMSLLNQPQQVVNTTNPYGIPSEVSTYGTETHYGEMDFADEPASINPYSVPTKQKDTVQAELDAIPKSTDAMVTPSSTKIYTLEELVDIDLPLVKNCIYIPVEDYRKRINLTVPLSLGDHTESLLTPYPDDKRVHVFCDHEIDDETPSLNQLMLIHDRALDEVMRILNSDTKTTDIALVKRILFINDIINNIVNLYLRLSGSSIIIDNGILDIPELLSVVKSSDNDVYDGLSGLINALQVFDHDEVNNRQWKHDLTILETDLKSVNLCLLVASVPMYLDKVVHNILIKELEDQFDGAPIVLRTLDNDYLCTVNDKGITIVAIDFYLP